MKSVLIINQHYLTGGIKKSLDNLLPILLERYQVKVVFLCGNNEDFNVKYPNVILPSPFLISSYLSSLKDLKKMDLWILRLLLKVICMIVAKLIGYENLINTLVFLSKDLGFYDSVISYSHDNWFKNGSFFGGCNELAIKKTHTNNRITWIHGEPYTIGLNKERAHKLFVNFDRIVTVSKACMKEFVEITNNEYTIDFIYNISDIKDIFLKSKNVEYKPSKKLRLVSVGRISKVAKRIDKINEIGKILLAKKIDFEWIVVGSGSELRDCIDKSKIYGIDKYIRYLGHKDNPYPYIKESDILVLVSDSESLSMVLREALILGTPVITTDFPASYETVVDGKNGFITGKNVEAIAEKIIFCVENPNVLKEMRSYLSAYPVNDEDSINKIYKILD